ncbi:PEP-CTERM sorting domain-containing protein [Comamonadaceae bacterium G21597-S1]|nr:PEP-CTERM sorting domain-containing protein [Comamonadaceae bacterium G21597-S1]
MNSMTKFGRVAMASALWLATIGLPAHAASVELVGPATSTVKVGDTFMVSVKGFDFAGLDGGGADLSFASGLVELLSVAVDPAWDFFSAPGDIDNTAGTLTGLSFNVWGPKSGNFDIASLTFRAKAAGIADIDLLPSVIWPFGLGGDIVDVGLVGTQVQIASSVPEPAVWAMLLAGVAVIGVRRAGKRT